VEPAAGEIERVAGLQRHVEDGLSRVAHRLGLVALVLERQLPGGLVDEPAFLARDLEREYVVRVVVDREALRRPRREVGVRLRRMAELRLELPAELRERLPVQVQALEDDRRTILELGEDPLDIRGAREGLRPPG